jgi:fatty-acyl-CoA synthase
MSANANGVNMDIKAAAAPPILRGAPLSEEPGLGALTLPGFLREVTARYADREALVMHTPGGVMRWTYAMLWKRAIEIAQSLLACGIGKDNRVGVMMTNRPEWVAAVFGAGLAGGVAVPLSTFSTPAELEYLLKASCVSILLFEQKVAKKDFADILQTLEPMMVTAPAGGLHSTKFPFLRRLAMVGEERCGPSGTIEDWDSFLSHGKPMSPAFVDAVAATTHPSDTGALFFSSGTTMRPKGILSTHRGIAIQLWRWPRIYALRDNVRTWTPNGFFWSGNFGMALGATLSIGGTMVLQQIFDPVEALELMQAERVTNPHAWPHQWAQLEAAPNWSSIDLSSFRYVDMTRPAGRHPSIRPTTWTEPVWCYGNTETFTISTAFASGTSAEVVGKSHGVALPGNTIKIVDPGTGEVMPRGERGEIAVKGPTLMLGYIGALPEETFDDEGFFHTGDAGYIDERARLVWEGRLTEVIKTGGANVSPIEVDEALHPCPGVKAAKTVGVPHETLGEIVVSCIVPHDGASIDQAAVQNYLKERLASYKVPRRVLFFREDELSLTGNAKIKSGALRELVTRRLREEISLGPRASSPQ